MPDNTRKYVSVLRRILEKCGEFPDLFPEGGAPREIVGRMVDQDESVHISIAQRKGRMVYVVNGSFYYGAGGADTSRPPNPKVVAIGLQDLHIEPETVAREFKKAIIVPLGYQMASKKLKKLEEELLR